MRNRSPRLLPITLLYTLIASLAAAPSASSAQSAVVEPALQRIVIFGASGRVGSRIVAEALARGHTVTGVSRDPTRIPTEHPQLTKVRGDVMDPDSIEAIVTGFDAVVSAISMEDFAVAIVDELENAERIGAQMTVAY